MASILLCEDEPFARKMMRENLEVADHTVDAVDNIFDLKTKAPQADVVLVDAIFGDGSCITDNTIRELKDTSIAIVILMSASEIRRVAPSADGFHVKTDPIEHLYKKINALLKRTA